MDAWCRQLRFASCAAVVPARDVGVLDGAPGPMPPLGRPVASGPGSGGPAGGYETVEVVPAGGAGVGPGPGLDVTFGLDVTPPSPPAGPGTAVVASVRARSWRSTSFEVIGAGRRIVTSRPTDSIARVTPKTTATVVTNHTATARVAGDLTTPAFHRAVPAEVKGG